MKKMRKMEFDGEHMSFVNEKKENERRKPEDVVRFLVFYFYQMERIVLNFISSLFLFSPQTQSQNSQYNREKQNKIN
jgi:hypothetical protein